MASAMIDAAKEVPDNSAPHNPKLEAELRRQRMKTMLAEARSGRYSKKRDPLTPLRFALGGKIRLLAGCALLAMAGFWAYQNKVISRETISAISDTAASGSVSAIRDSLQQVTTDAAAQSGSLPPLLGTTGWAVGFAGLLLAASGLVSGWRISLFAIPGVAIAILGSSWGVPAIGLAPAWSVACASAFAVFIVGVFLAGSGDGDC